MKYEGENEKDLKDQQDFVKPDPQHYPKDGQCRQKILQVPWIPDWSRNAMWLIVGSFCCVLAVERPNLGCRTLVYRNFTRIIGGLLRDLGDWVVPTRIKCAQLLYILLINEEENVTQHMEKVLSGLFKACTDEEKLVVEYVRRFIQLSHFQNNLCIIAFINMLVCRKLSRCRSV